MIELHATPASEETYGLAEGPFWDAARQRLLWVDVNAGHVHVGDLSGDQVVTRDRLAFGGTVGAVVCAADGSLLVAGARHLHNVAPDGTVADGQQLISYDKASRLNDGGCDATGRFLVGSVAWDDRQNDEQLMRVEHSGQVTVLDDDLDLANGLAFAPDGASLYNIDTTPGVVWIRSYDNESGAVGPRRQFLQITDGLPDGMCVDVDGNLWIAIWGAGQVRCYTPAGDLVATAHVPAPNTASVAFIGPGLDTLLITTASEQLYPAERAKFPDSGRLFICKVGTTGTPVPGWAGP